MILFAYAVVFFTVFAVISFFLTERGIRGPWERQGPYHVAQQVRHRNRLICMVVFVLTAISAVMEWFLTDFHHVLLDAQYAVGDRFGSDPLLVTESTLGGLSWGLYLVVLLGVVAGLLVGTGIAAQRFAIMRGTRWTAYV